MQNYPPNPYGPNPNDQTTSPYGQTQPTYPYQQYPPMPPRPPQKPKWYKSNHGIIALLVFFFPVGLFLMWRDATWPKTAKWVVTGIFAAYIAVYSVVSVQAESRRADLASTPQVQAQVQPPTYASNPTVVPTHAPAPTPTSTPTPVPPQVQQPEPTQRPVSTGVNGNPWGYDFNPGTVITSPPAAFCSYFNCITSFWSGTGYVIQCADGMYSKSGGHSGSCSKHGGDAAILYQH